MPVTFPEETPISDTQTIQTQIKHPKWLNIYSRDTAVFNRLPSNRIDISSYEGFLDHPQQNSNSYNEIQRTTYSPPVATATTTQRPYSPVDHDGLSPLTNDLAEARTRNRRRRRRPCIPVYHNPSYRSNPKGAGRTLWDLNFYLTNIFPSESGSSDNIPSNTGSYGGDSDYNKPDYDHYGGYECIPNPHYTGGHFPHHHNHNHNHNHHHGSHGSGSYGGDGDYDGVQNDNRPSGGLLGFFGQGGLFDFTGGNTGGTVSNDRPPLFTPGTLSDPAYDDTKPVFEINVHDTVQNLVI